MTCVAGLVHEGRVLIAGDSAGVAGWSLTIRADEKVWASDGWVFGFTTSFRMGQLLRWKFTPPPLGDGPLEAYMATTFIDAIRTTLRDAGWLKVDNQREEGGNFLVGTAGRLFEVYDDFQVAEAADGYAAVGCGFEIALGALYATAHLKTPNHRLKTALAAAEHLNAGVRGPFTIATSKGAE